MKKLLLLSIVLLFAAIACNPKMDQQGADSRTPQTPAEGSGQEPDARLNDIWALVAIDDRIIRPEDFPSGVPTLDLQVANGKVYGYAGCNRMTGTVAAVREQLSFGLLASTKRACPAMQLEQQYLQALSDQILTYELDGLHLYLKGSDHQLKFKKVD